jgi:ribosome-associated protein
VPVHVDGAKQHEDITKASRPTAMGQKLYISDRIVIDDSELQEQFVRAPGPGGQNVNKVATAVQLRWDLARSQSVPQDVRERLQRLAGRRLSADGVLTIDAHRYRTQAGNREDARRRLVELIRAACVVPKARRPTRPTAASRERRLAQKRTRGAVKRSRRFVTRRPYPCFLSSQRPLRE